MNQINGHTRLKGLNKFKLKNTVYIIVLLSLSFEAGLSQNQPDSLYKDFGVSVAMNNYQIKEHILNNIRHAGIFPALGFTYQWSTDRILQMTELFFIVNMLKSRYEADPAPLVIDLSLKYQQVRFVTAFRQDLKLFLGGSGGLYSHMGVFSNWDDSHIYWLTYYYIGFNGLISYKDPMTSSAYLEFGIPLISVVSRPRGKFFYKVINNSFSWIFKEIHKDLRITSIYEHFVLNIDLGYIFKHSKTFSQKVFWRLNYTNTQMSYSRELSILTHILGTTFLF